MTNRAVTTEDVKIMTKSELQDFIHERICISCENVPAHGYVYCPACLGWETFKAHPVLVAAKRRIIKMESKQKELV